MINFSRAVTAITLCALLAGCSLGARNLTVADIERKTSNNKTSGKNLPVEEKMEVDIYQAYTAYVEQVEKGDHFRAIAISRLAGLELEAEFVKFLAW